MPKLAKIKPSWKTVLSTMQNDSFHEFIDKTNLYHFTTDFDRSCVLQLMGTDIENSLFKYRISYDDDDLLSLAARGWIRKHYIDTYM